MYILLGGIEGGSKYQIANVQHTHSSFMLKTLLS